MLHPWWFTRYFKYYSTLMGGHVLPSLFESIRMSVSNPYQSTHEVAVDPFNSHRTYGGIGRAAYFFGGIGISIVQNVVTVALAGSGDVGSVAVIPIALVAVAGTVALACFRMINLGSSGWWGLGIIVPILNIFVGLRCLICPEGYADHKTLDLAGKMISGILIAIIVLGVIAFVAVVATSPR